MHKTNGAQVWRGTAAATATAATATAATDILVLAWTFSWLWFGISAWSLVILACCASLGERCATLVGYWITSRIIFSVKVKVLEGSLYAYGCVTIFPYCLWGNEHTYFSNRLWAHTILGQSNCWKIDWEDLLSWSQSFVATTKS